MLPSLLARASIWKHRSGISLICSATRPQFLDARGEGMTPGLTAPIFAGPHVHWVSFILSIPKIPSGLDSHRKVESSHH